MSGHSMSGSPETPRDLAHLGHVEMLTPRIEASLAFFTDVFGMTEAGREGQSVYLRGWDDYEFASLKLTEAPLPGLAHVAFRTWSREALARRVAVLEASGHGIGWTDGDMGHGPSYRAHGPDGHVFEIYFETRKYQAPDALKPALKNQAQRFPARGMSVRRLDHLNLLCSEVEPTRDFLRDQLGMRLTEAIVLDSGIWGGAWMTATNKTYDIAFTRDHSGRRGRFHHVTYAIDSREEILRAADIALEAGVPIETGPHKHAVQQTFFLYLEEPGGNRVEVANTGARLMLDPDWEPVIWTETERKKGQAWGLKTVESFHTRGTPP
ncbi:catechol 2,3-dioxygenase [Phreatobacter oligotrophus]|uniref:Catechol 2,3-dioxygenase n=2 Tax=Phreatobacter oligotrophus TaxID=1122261 RepID=A0A2T4ZHD7_9HYPH|nr:catechol 2,3-dioxygenase [Phreatobacter oligotrophus]